MNIPIHWCRKQAQLLLIKPVIKPGIQLTCSLGLWYIFGYLMHWLSAYTNCCTDTTKSRTKNRTYPKLVEWFYSQNSSGHPRSLFPWYWSCDRWAAGPGEDGDRGCDPGYPAPRWARQRLPGVTRCDRKYQQTSQHARTGKEISGGYRYPIL